jgi:hypothetical protein
VLGAVSSQPPDLDAADSAVVAMDGATGKQVWSLADRYRRSEVGFVTGDVALLYVRAETGHDDVVLVERRPARRSSGSGRTSAVRTRARATVRG